MIQNHPPLAERLEHVKAFMAQSVLPSEDKPKTLPHLFGQIPQFPGVSALDFDRFKGQPLMIGEPVPLKYTPLPITPHPRSAVG